MSSIRALIVDDEQLAREGLAMRLAQFDDITVKAECANGEEALSVLQSTCVDVMFLDIEMPRLNGLELLEVMQQHLPIMPLVVFVTAYKEFALNAFDCDAHDYLLKPFDERRLQTCLQRLRQACEQRQMCDQHDELSSLLAKKTGHSLMGFLDELKRTNEAGTQTLQQTISMKSGTEWIRIKLASVLWIEAAGDYMCVHTYDGNHIVRKTMSQFEKELDSQHFPRINRSIIVNREKVTKMTPNANGEYVATLETGDQLKISRKYKLKFDELVKA